MAGRKVFAVQSILQSADVNGYLMDQTVPRFTTTTQRDGQWASPPDGAMCVTVDTFTVWLRKAGVWQPPPGRLIASAVTATAGGISKPGGVSDVLSITIAARPYPTIVRAVAEQWFGFAAGAINASNDVIRIRDSVIVAQSPGISQAIAGAWFLCNLQAEWTSAANLDNSFKTRVNPNGTAWVDSRVSYQLFAA